MSALPIEDAERKNELEGTTAAPDQLLTELECIRGECVWVKGTSHSFNKAPALSEHFPASTDTAVQCSSETHPAAHAALLALCLVAFCTEFSFHIGGSDGAGWKMAVIESKMLNL